MNTHPNTPFGKFFHKIGLWRPTFEQAIKDAYDNLHDFEKTAVKDASGWIAVINETLNQTPTFVFEVLKLKFPTLTKEAITDFINSVNAQVLKVDSEIPDDYESGLMKLQDYLKQYDGHTWQAITRAVVTVGTDVLLKGASPIQAISTLLEYVYLTFIKGKVTTA